MSEIPGKIKRILETWRALCYSRAVFSEGQSLLVATARTLNGGRFPALAPAAGRGMLGDECPTAWREPCRSDGVSG
jgi:hypothetical protein